jgi:hypothetical protein
MNDLWIYIIGYFAFGFIVALMAYDDNYHDANTTTMRILLWPFIFMHSLIVIIHHILERMR